MINVTENSKNRDATSEYIFHRALAIALVSVRFIIEMGIKRAGVLDHQSIYALDQMTNIINSIKEIREALTPNEEKLLRLNSGEWPNQILVQMSWHTEACGCLLWALGKIPVMPPFDRPFDQTLLDAYFYKMHSLEWVISLMRSHVHLREKKEILLMKKKAERFFQRFIFSELVRKGKKKLPLKPYNDIFHFSDLDFPIGPSGDIYLLGQEFCDLSQQEEQTLFPIIVSRVHSLNWTCNPNLVWDEMNLDYLYALPE